MLHTDVRPHRTREELEDALAHMAQAPKSESAVALIVTRPAPGVRQTPQEVRLSIQGGVEGDRWAKGSWMTTDDGAPHPNVQVNLMSVRAAEAIAGDPANWPPTGNNFFMDIDMSPDNMPPGTRLSIGSAEIEISREPNKGCKLFVDRYGHAACVFVNVGKGRALCARGLYARVVKDGTVRLGDKVEKI
ncbi:MAG: MOSC domain-containing protein [Pseudomonadota bacterium]